eukprot:SAG31_NODE_3351_length_4373_cov_5.225784_3_plen_58_part_00
MCGCCYVLHGIVKSDNCASYALDSSVRFGAMRGKGLLSRFCANYQRNAGLLSRDVTH